MSTDAHKLVFSSTGSATCRHKPVWYDAGRSISEEFEATAPLGREGALAGELTKPRQCRLCQRASQRLGRHFSTQRCRLPRQCGENSRLPCCSAFLRSGVKASIGVGKSGVTP